MDCQEEILRALEGKIDDFYLAGGTALARFYFHHRESEDLDFFTQKFVRSKVFETTQEIEKNLKYGVELINDYDKKGRVKVMIFMVRFKRKDLQKLDFVEDPLKLMSELKIVDGIPVLSLEDIYLRKICTVAGTIESLDLTGRRIVMGGRQEPKDFCDLYFLSQTSTSLSDFVMPNCNQVVKEGLIRWFRTYDRMQIKMGILELKMKRQVDYQEMERHFKREIERLIKKEIDFI